MKTIEFWTDKAMKETGEMLQNVEYYRAWAKEIQEDALRHAAKIVSENCDRSRGAKFYQYKIGLNDGYDISEQAIIAEIEKLRL